MVRIIVIDMKNSDFREMEPYKSMKETVEDFVYDYEKDCVSISITKGELNEFISSYDEDQKFFIDYRIDKICDDSDSVLITSSIELFSTDIFPIEMMDIALHEISDNKPPILYAKECENPRPDINILGDSGTIERKYLACSDYLFEVLVQLTALNIAYLSRT